MIPYGHRIKITKKIKEMNKLKNTNLTISAAEEQKPKSNNQYDELPMEDLDSISIINNNTVRNKKDESFISKVSTKKESKLLKIKKASNLTDGEDHKKRLFHKAVIDFVNENRPKYDENGEDIKYKILTTNTI